MPKSARKTKPATRKDERARRAPERGVQGAPTRAAEPMHKDDPARDKAEMEGSVLQPLPHAD
jgi:hypothetical protein